MSRSNEEQPARARISPDDGDEVKPIDRDQDLDDGTPSGTMVGGVVGAGLGAVVGGPVGAIIGAGLGAAGGAAAEESNKDDGNVPTGNPTDADSKRSKMTYSGQVYEEGSLEDVKRRDTV